MNFKSTSESRPRQSKTMDLIDVDQIPDTPDRLVAAGAHSNDGYNFGRRNDSSLNNRVVNKDYTNGRMKSQSREKVEPVTVNGKRRLYTHLDSCSSPPEFQSFNNRKHNIDTAGYDKGKSLCNFNVPKLTDHIGGSFSGLTKNNTYKKGVLPVNSFSAMDRTNKSCTLNNSSKTGPSFDRGKGVDFKAESKPSAFGQPSTSFKVPRQKMLVRNGCISPHNIAKAKDVELKQESGSKVEIQSGSGTVASSDGQSNTVDIKDLIAEAKDSRRLKGKEVSLNPSSEEPNAGSSHLPYRRLIFNAPAESISDCNVDAKGWRTTHNHRKQRDIGQHNNGIVQQDRRNESDIQHLNESVVVSSPSVHDSPQTISPHVHKLGNHRQREDSASKRHGKHSFSYIDESVGEPSSSSKRKKSSGGVGPSDPVSDPNNNNESSSFRALQIEADEILARELQEQLYGEEPASATQFHEMDTSLAFVMPQPQQNSSSRIAGGRHASRHRGASLLNVPEQVQPSTSSHLHSFRRYRQPRPRASTRMSQLRNHHAMSSTSTSYQRNSMFPPNMDVELRLEILETLESTRNFRMASEFLPLRREFNEDDYEMLLALDDNNHLHGGATRAQINNLPESTVQAENLQECAICLETPTIGETIRHLPCLHGFHKECIDEWLGRKTLCPVCKSSVT